MIAIAAVNSPVWITITVRRRSVRAVLRKELYLTRKEHSCPWADLLDVGIGRPAESASLTSMIMPIAIARSTTAAAMSPARLRR